MSKRVEAQQGNITINAITGYVEFEHVDAIVARTATTGSGGFLVDKGAGLEQVALLSEITGSITTSTPLSIEADILTATPPTNEAVTDLLRFMDNDSSDVLGTVGYTGSSVLQITNNMQGSNMEFVTENAAGTAQTLITLDPDLESVILPLSNDAVTPTLAFGDGDTGFYEASDDSLKISVTGSDRYTIDAVGIYVTQSTGPSMVNEAVTSTNPTFLPNRSDPDTGLAWTAADQLALVAGGKEMLRLSETGVSTTDQVIIGPAGVIGAAATPSLAFGDGNTGFFENGDNELSVSVGGVRQWYYSSVSFRGNAGDSPVLENNTPSSTDPNIIPNRSDLDTGIGWTAADQLALVSGGVEMLRLSETGVATTDQVIIAPGATLRGDAATPSLAFGDGDTGFYEQADDQLVLSLVGQSKWFFVGNTFYSNSSGGPYLLNAAAGPAAPTIVPRRSDLDTGLGWNADDQLSLVAGGAEVVRVAEDVSGNYINVEGSVFSLEKSAALADVANYGQIWVRQDAPNTLMYTDDAGNDFTANNVLEIEYAYSSATAAADPGAGTIRFNSVTIGSITEAYIDDVDNTARDNSIMLANLATGDVLTFRSATDPADYIIAKVTSATTDNTGYWTVPLTLIHTGTIFTDTDLLRIDVEWAGSQVPPDGITGTVANDQVVVGTGTNSVDSSANLTYNGTTLTMAGAGAQLLLPLENDAVTPTFAFGDGDSGFYEETDDVIAISVAGTRTYLYNSTAYASVTTSGFYLDATASSSTNPAFAFQGDTDTGVGRAGADALALVTGAVEAKRFQAATLQTTDATQTEIISIAVASGTTFGYRINIVGNEAATGDTVFESIFGAIHNQGGTTATVGSDIVDRTDDAGATGWNIIVAADDTTDALTVDVQGEAAHTIDWKVSVEILEV